MAVTNAKAAPKTSTVKKEVKKQLTEESKGAKPKPIAKPKLNAINPMVQLAEKMRFFEQMRGLTYKRELILKALTDLQSFNYHSDGTCTFLIRDSTGKKEFLTTNSNLITLVAEILQKTLEERKSEIDSQIIGFQIL